VAAKGKKNAKVKWAIGGTEPDDLPDFQSNDDIVRKNKGALPPKGRTRVLVKKITRKENKNGDDMLTVTCEIAEKGAKSEQKFNGYAMWERLNVTEQGAPYLKRFLTAIGVTWNDFISKTVADETAEPAVITQIGKVKFSKPVEAFVSVKHGVNQSDEDEAEVGRFLPPSEESDEDDDDDESDEDDDDDDIDVEDDDDDDDDDEDDDSDDEDDDDADDDEDDDDDEDEDEEEALREELGALKVPALKKRAIRSGADEDDMPSKKADLIDHIVELELESDDDDDDDEDDEEFDREQQEKQIKAEVKKLDLTELRNRARANGRKASELKGAKKPALVKMILEDEIPPF
jgi:hypothetical protein